LVRARCQCANSTGTRMNLHGDIAKFNARTRSTIARLWVEVNTRVSGTLRWNTSVSSFPVLQKHRATRCDQHEHRHREQNFALSSILSTRLWRLESVK